jgi:hypothetical protein
VFEIFITNSTGLPGEYTCWEDVTVTAMSASLHDPGEIEPVGETESEGVGVGDGLRVGNGDGLVVLAVGAEDPPGEINHHNSANATSTARTTMIRRRQ